MRFRDCEIIADQNIHEDVVAWLFSQGISVRPLAQVLAGRLRTTLLLNWRAAPHSSS
jgi:hypothetical protein